MQLKPFGIGAVREIYAGERYDAPHRGRQQRREHEYVLIGHRFLSWPEKS
jgi:hypothetical protein